ncbi:5-(carboxyamino)imidazole ribonucleotide mutase [Alkalibaculum sp. M08DMB]|uniref:N5-carboxyaminoimidazole ribonucleotide mutase n=1 Tax=Alkalibaculum sporogenes TaxID=2655001 RepID=A0A6A7K6F2_9FIRM|nr:5-(carboxyamino)imidazole ribonucleotide mutase [Alkalibaculum sporogenes]MPW24962.1 5-(carboxyamino)imidazole ribonucleotide mutase [Alkalibaculum sporogenes]
MPRIAIVMGSDTDYQVVKETITILRKFEVEVDVRVISAHRTPELAFEYAKNAEKDGIELIIGAAGKAAHLPGVLAGISPLPVIGLPIKSSTMDGLDSLLSIVQMPVGVPVATVAINGSVNAGLLAVQVLSVKYPHLRDAYRKYKTELADQVVEKNKNVQEMMAE